MPDPAPKTSPRRRPARYTRLLPVNVRPDFGERLYAIADREGLTRAEWIRRELERAADRADRKAGKAGAAG